MTTKCVSIAGANTLLGQHLLTRLVSDLSVEIMSLHDCLANGENVRICDSQQWNVDSEVIKHLSDVPLLAPEAPALAPVLLSFYPIMARKRSKRSTSRGAPVSSLIVNMHV